MGPEARATEQSERQLEALFAQAPLGIAIIDSTTGRFRRINPRYCEIVGYSGAEMLGLTFQQLTHPDDLAADLAGMQRMLAGEHRAFQMDKRYLRKDGSVVWVNLTAVPLWEGTGAHLQHLAMVEDITARRRAEAALRDSEQQLSSIYHTVGDVIFHLAVEPGDRYRFLSVNAAFSRVTGVPAEALVGHGVDEVIPAASLGLVLARYRQAIAEKAIVRWQETTDYPTGRLTGEVSVAPVFDATGRCTHLVGSVHDVTERNRAEQALSVSERQLKKAQHIAHMGFLDWNLASNAIYLSDEVYALYGLEKTGELTTPEFVSEIVHPDDVAAVRAALEAAIEGRQRYDIDHRIVRPDGEIRWVSAQAELGLGEGGKPETLLGTIIDITPRKRAEEALRESERRYRATLDNTLEGCQLIGFDWRYLYLNDAAAGHSRRPKTELLGHIMPEEWPGIEATSLYRLIARCLEQRLAGQEDVELSFADGSKGWFDVRVQPVSEGALVLSIELTRRMQAELALRALNLELESEVAARTRELVVAKERAESADRLKSAFLATMSHELRTPLNSIIGFSGILLQRLPGPLNDEQAKQLGMVFRSAEHLLALINDVLDLSKIEAGQLQLVIEHFDLRRSIESAVATVRPAVERKGLALEVELAPDVGAMASDRLRVEQVLLNLLSNAIKFTDRGKIRIEATLAARRVTVRVTDTGLGIRQHEQDRLFKPFSQVDAGINKQHEGTGLGLSICRRLVELLGGSIWVESEWGRGSAFCFELPVAKEVLE